MSWICAAAFVNRFFARQKKFVGVSSANATGITEFLEVIDVVKEEYIK